MVKFRTIVVNLTIHAIKLPTISAKLASTFVVKFCTNVRKLPIVAPKLRSVLFIKLYIVAAKLLTLKIKID